MQGSKKCAFRRHNATRNVRFAGTKRSMCSKRYPEPVDTKDLTVVGVARSQCSVFAAKFCRRYTISSFIAPPNGEIFRIFYRTTLRLAPTCDLNVGLIRCLILVFFEFLISTSNLANKQIFKTLPFRRRRSDQKCNAGFLFVYVWRCRVQSLVSIGQEMWEE